MQKMSYYPSYLPEEEIQKVIFDNDYLNYIENKRALQESSIYQSGDETLSNGQLREQSPTSENEVTSNQQLNVQSTDELVNQANQRSTLPAAKIHQAAEEKKKALQFVQYECIKSELKEEYEKKVGFLHKRLNKKA